MGRLLLQITDNYFIFLIIAIQSQEKKFPFNLPIIYKILSNCVASPKHVFLVILSDRGFEGLILKIQFFQAS